jgi:hypothetical protein
MVVQSPGQEGSKMLICLDSYRGGVPEGRIYGPGFGTETFQSLTQFLIKVENLLDDMQFPQSCTAKRTFPTITIPLETIPPLSQMRRGAEATFEIRVIFRQHTSWQGTILWLEKNLTQNFRSVLELILLMDSALRQQEMDDAS